MLWDKGFVGTYLYFFKTVFMITEFYNCVFSSILAEISEQKSYFKSLNWGIIIITELLTAFLLLFTASYNNLGLKALQKRLQNIFIHKSSGRGGLFFFAEQQFFVWLSVFS